jgi:hypothetical protein
MVSGTLQQWLASASDAIICRLMLTDLLTGRLQPQHALGRLPVDEQLLLIRKQAAGGAVLPGMNAKRNLSPGRMTVLVQPPRASTVGELPSICQVVTGPLFALSARTWIITWGLVQTYSFTVPERVTVLSRWYMAKE